MPLLLHGARVQGAWSRVLWVDGTISVLDTKTPLCAAGALLCAFLPGAMARAERADRDQPIYVQADRWTHDDLKRISTLSGRAIVTQGTTVLKGDRVVIREDPQGYYFLNSTAGRGARAY